MKSLQLTQNRMLRALNGSKIKDKISTSSLLNKFKLLAVNQLAGQIKLTEVWKSLNVEGYPIVLEPYKTLTTTTTGLRPQPNRIFNDSSRLSCSKFSFHVDAARLWNLAPQTIKSADTLGRAKIAILAHCKTLPIWRQSGSLQTSPCYIVIKKLSVSERNREGNRNGQTKRLASNGQDLLYTHFVVFFIIL